MADVVSTRILRLHGVTPRTALGADGSPSDVGSGSGDSITWDGNTLVINASRIVVPWPQEILWTHNGTVAADEVMVRVPFVRATAFHGLVDSQGVVGVAPTAQTDFDIRKNGVSIGTMRFAAGQTVAEFILEATTVFAIGDVMLVVGPSSPDSTLADLGFWITGTGGIQTKSGGSAVSGSGSVAMVGVAYEPAPWSWGNGGSGQLGDNAFHWTNTPAQISGLATCSMLAAGDHHSAVIRTGSLLTCGAAGYGQLGNGTYSPDKKVFADVGGSADWAYVSCGYNNTFGIKSGGSMWACGSQSAGQVGNGSGVDEPSLVQIGGTSDWAKVSGGFDHAGAIKTGGTLWTWGSDSGGKLGNGAPTSNVTTPTQIGSATDWAEVSCGGGHTAAVTTGGKFYTWGTNSSGQLGQGDTTARTVPTQVGSGTDWAEVSCGESHTIARKTDGSIWTCGSATNGRLGNGQTVGQAVDFEQCGTDVDWIAVRASYANSAALKSNGDLYTCGKASDGQLGNRTTTPDVSVLTQIGAAVTWSMVAPGGFHVLAQG